MGFKGMNFTCPECDLKQPVTKKNIIIYIFLKQPVYNTIEFICECENSVRVFGLNQYIETCNPKKYTVVTTEYADEGTIRGFAKIYFNETLAEKKEAMVQYFIKILEDVNTPADIEWGP